MTKLKRWLSVMLATTVLATSMLALGISAAAEDEWCADDPIFLVDGISFRLTGYWLKSNLPQVNGVTYAITVPADAKVSYSIPSGETSRAKVVWNRSDSSRADNVLLASVTVSGNGSFVTKAVLADDNLNKTVYGQANDAMQFNVPWNHLD